MYLGLDLGTSGLKALLVDDQERTIASATVPLSVQRPHSGWSEQDPQTWLAAAISAIDQIHARCPAQCGAVRAIGIAGHMHGAVLLDATDAVLRPCILWNDTRAANECGILEETVPDLWTLAGNRAMAGFTAPKVLWVRRNEPEIFAKTTRVLLPKAWLRLALTGDAVEDMSDASGTLWLDVGARCWSERLLDATGLRLDAMPRLVEGSVAAGRLHADYAARWGMTTLPLFAGGAGDNAAGAIGLGAVQAGSAFVSLGTSGVLWVTTQCFRPYPEAAVHSFCHALPSLWHQMGVTLSAAASLSWWAQITGQPEQQLVEEVGPALQNTSPVLFLPYLSGERTPHNDTTLRGMFAQLSHESDRAAMTQAVLEGVAFSIRDCLDALKASGTEIGAASVIGGGSRSRLWLEILATVLGIPLHRLSAGEHGAALGAARLARLADTGEDVVAVCRPPAIAETIEPHESLRDAYEDKLRQYRAVTIRGTANLGLRHNR